MVIGVDVGGTKLAAGVANEDGIVEKWKWPVARSFEDTVAQIAESAGRARAQAVGVIVPGIYDGNTGMAWAPNLWGMDEVPLRDALQRVVRVPVVIDSDRAGYVAGEQWLGVARGLSDVVFVAVGTGIGAGIVSGGRVISGAHGIAGAVGWSALDRQWRKEYANCGCWEAEASGPGLARLAGMATSEDVVEAARLGDETAREWIRHSAEYTGMGVANLISILDPQMVVLGGGLMQSAGLMLDTIRETAALWAQPIAFRKTRIEVSTLGEDAGLLGAARLALLSIG